MCPLPGRCCVVADAAGPPPARARYSAGAAARRLLGAAPVQWEHGNSLKHVSIQGRDCANVCPTKRSFELTLRAVHATFLNCTVRPWRHAHGPAHAPKDWARVRHASGSDMPVGLRSCGGVRGPAAAGSRGAVGSRGPGWRARGAAAAGSRDSGCVATAAGWAVAGSQRHAAAAAADRPAAGAAAGWPAAQRRSSAAAASAARMVAEPVLGRHVLL